LPETTGSGGYFLMGIRVRRAHASLEALAFLP